MQANVHCARALEIGLRTVKPTVAIRSMEGKPLILYVDDDDMLAFLVQRELAGFEIFHVDNVDDAMEFLNRSGVYEDARRPALVLLDLNMPRRDGFQVLAEIRATPSLAMVPVAIFTTSQSPADRAKAFAHGADHFIQKPSGLGGFSDLATTLADIVRRGT